MENKNIILPDQTASKEYQIPELVDLNCVKEAQGSNCGPGSSDLVSCDLGSAHIYT